jgi:hypothetical protein
VGAQIVPTLLDVARVPSKPQYEMASDLPLVLWDCGFEDVRFVGEPDELAYLHAHVRALWMERYTRTILTDGLLRLIADAYVPAALVPNLPTEPPPPRFLRWAEAQPLCPPTTRPRSWTPLLQRPVERVLPPPVSVGSDDGGDNEDD